ncbi:tRNA dimethylallyltransferase, mitochondrial [Conoideocrella luteorostrata]|uniref:tRNA dimethylallyltransferase n=1 Tax=Conoideocrella luteorostrata TaxID=1105319 RepID=A0AAJ0D222_9HYPO|nr:tRNA dimethylallyltransferase, mitochondrial [Conoideocrella luteorostrata]
MAANTAPTQPLLVVLGSTGTGKSDLAVELARRFKGEIINSDAMQLYNGLPIITNKITPVEQKGIPHHLLGHIPLHEAPWVVDTYKREATKVISEIRSRGNLPILVGGTQYYVDPLLFTDVILDEVQQPQSADSVMTFPILDQPTEVLLEELRKCDPIMAERWHPKDRRKISRSLEIYLHTGKPASSFYAEQEARKVAMARGEVAVQPWEKLLFWVYSEKEILRERLDKRVDKMRHAGLLDEVRELYTCKKEMDKMGKTQDTTKGIFQSIGYKQFEPYLQALDAGKGDAEIEKLNAAALEDMKAATRRYANYQTKWIRLKQMRRLQDEGPEAVNSLYVVDSTDTSLFQENVVEPAAQLTEKFLRGDLLPAAADISETARRVLSSAIEPPPKETPMKRTCEVCQTVLVTEQAWERHVKSTGHRRVMKKKQKLALVAVGATTATKEKMADDQPRRSEGSRASKELPSGSACQNFVASICLEGLSETLNQARDLNTYKGIIDATSTEDLAKTTGEHKGNSFGGDRSSNLLTEVTGSKAETTGDDITGLSDVAKLGAAN